MIDAVSFRALFSFSMIGVIWTTSLAGCGSPSETSGTGGSTSTGCTAGETPRPDGGCCAAGELLLDDGRCLPAGTQENGCVAGEVPVDEGPVGGGSCRPAGIPPERCTNGFEPDGKGGCNAILPVDTCSAGKMALPGETKCREIAPCGTGTWGDVPVGANTQFVDGNYDVQMGLSDGSMAHPWTAVQDGVDAADEGAVVAVAGGSYAEDVIISGHPVRLWGRCPALVEIVSTGTGFSSILVKENADATEIRDIAVRGPSEGIGVTGSVGVLLDRVWVHATDGIGIDVENQLGETGVSISRSLVEAAHDLGVFVVGSTVAVDATTVRGTLPALADGKYGWGVNIVDDVDKKTRSSVMLSSSIVEQNCGEGVLVKRSDVGFNRVVVRDTRATSAMKGGRGIELHSGTIAAVTSSVVERNHDAGLFVSGATAHVEETIVRGTETAAPDGTVAAGIYVRNNDVDIGNLELFSCMVERNAVVGINVDGGVAVIDGTIARDTLPVGASPAWGQGIYVQSDALGGTRGNLKLLHSVVDANREAGVFVGDSDATIDGTAVRGTDAAVPTVNGGRGVNIQDRDAPATGSIVVIRSSVFAGNREVGVMTLGSKTMLEGVLVEDTQPRASDGDAGWGVGFQDTAGSRASGRVSGCVVRRNRGVGISIYDSDVDVDATLVSGTTPISDGSFGDGIDVLAFHTTASSMITASSVVGCARVGIASFAGSVSLGATLLKDNLMDIDSQSWNGVSASYENLGGNVCMTGGETVTCQAKPQNVSPPAPIQASP